MSITTWIRVSDLVDASLQLPLEERARFLDAVCRDQELRSYVDSLVTPFDEARDFLEEPAFESYARSRSEEFLGDTDGWIERRIGDYRIVEKIGEGGMGAVFRAIRADDQYSKQVAIKLLKEGFASSYALARFRAERQILANLEHPNIARLLDGGQTEEGIPYFVMEFVEGKPIDEYCDEHRLSIDKRLRLFLTVCSTVEYAHQNLVIHRDIKPANILVTVDGTPKLLDFGIARLLNPDLSPKESEHTISLLRVMTPEYASPEQIRGDAVTTSSDVYSLGVVLYVLLTGHRPYNLTGRLPSADAEMVCSLEPRRPSSVVARTEKECNESVLSPAAISAVRDDKPERLRRRLSGDLDNIVLMALRKEPQRRYASVGQFSRDIQFHLQDAPVLAHRDTFAYRTGKFAKRYRWACLSITVFILTLLAGILATLHQARIASAERAKAERRFNDVRRLANAMMFDVHDSIEDLPGATAARKVLVADALQYLDSLSHEVTGDPSLQQELATAYEKLGDVQGLAPYANLGDLSGAIASYNKALPIRLALTSSNPHDQMAQNLLAALYYRMAYSFEANGEFDQALESIRKALALNEAAATQQQDARTLDRLAGTHYELARILADVGALDEALMHYRQAVSIHNGVQNPTMKESQLLHTHLAGDYNGMSRVYELKGDFNSAISAGDQAEEYLKQLLKDEPQDATLQTFRVEAESQLGDVLDRKGRPNDALSLLRQARRNSLDLTASDPSNALVATDLSYIDTYLGETLLAKKLIPAAIASFSSAVSEFEAVAHKSGQSPEIAFGLAESYAGLAAAHAQMASSAREGRVRECSKTLHFYGKSQEILSELQQRAPKTPQYQWLERQISDGRAVCSNEG
jgi:eukaryotic-like serine/threonine-protein kinase